jgi:hypothetical protein
MTQEKHTNLATIAVEWHAREDYESVIEYFILKNTKRIRASLGNVVFGNYGITNSFVSQRDTNPWF